MSDSNVYVTDKQFGWLPANVLEQDNKTATVRVFDADGNEPLGEREVKLSDYPNHALPLQNVDAGGNLMEMPDMVDLPSLHEAAILYNLRARHKKRNPYTRVGDLIIAVNPFQWMKSLYSDENRAKYVEKLIYGYNQLGGGGGDQLAGLAPHVYETSCGAFRGLAVEGTHQSILVSGESGAGKTETVKIVMSHLASIQQQTADGQQHHHLVVQRVLDGQPLLEAFGNAKTVRNDNSSRFGKFIQMQFDVEDATQAAFSGRALPNCVLAGSTCETYLLEKSRVVSHESPERTYHIFYQLLAASDSSKETFWSHLVGKGPQDFKYVSGGTTHHPVLKIDGLTDLERHERTEKALALLSITGSKLQTLYVALCCVMQLGNVDFGEHPDDDDKSCVTSRGELATMSNLLGVDEAFLEKSLTHRTVVAGKESYSVPMKAGDAKDGCDAFAKEIYQQIFDWLVREINAVTCAEANYDHARDVEEYGLIGLLDIFGFESFEVNRFEQLCINYTNEKLQQKYTLDIFRSVQEEYSDEGIELGEIPFEDNAEVLRLIEGKIGIIAVLNEECVRPKGNDTSFVSKVKSVNKEVTCLINKRLHKPKEFGILHYAGAVTYDATSFVQKNTDALPKDLIECACKSSNELIRVELKAAADAKASGSGKPRVGKRGAATLTVATKFKSQLTKLMTDITKTKTRYIRCIKPNPEKVPLQMNMFTSGEQLRCAGVVAAVTISRVAFPNRLTHETALERFSCLSHVDLDQVVEEKKEESENDGTGFRDAVTTLLEGLLQSRETKVGGRVIKAFEMGKSRVYFRVGALEYLESQRLVALGVFATAIERIVRGFVARAIYWKTRAATMVSQANARRTIARKAFLKCKNAAIMMQCWSRCIASKRELIRLQREKASIQIQSRWRTVLAMAVLAKQKKAATIIQKTARGAIQRPKYRQALKEAEEEARVNSKLAALQRRLQEAEMKWIQADKKRIEAEKRAEGLVSGGTVSEVSEPAAATPASEEKKSEGTATATSSATSEQQQALIDESNEMLEYFRKEVFKLKSSNYLLRTDLTSLKEQHKRLQMHAESVDASSSALKQNMINLGNTNRKLVYQVTEQKEYIGKLKQDLKMEMVRHVADLKRRREEILGRDKMHEAEMNRLRRENERLRRIVAGEEGVELEGEDPKSSAPRYERASFEQQRGTLLTRLARKSQLRELEGEIPETGNDSDEEWPQDNPQVDYDGAAPQAWSSGFRGGRGRPHYFSRRFGGGYHHYDRRFGGGGRGYGGRFSGYNAGRSSSRFAGPAPLASVPGTSLGSARAAMTSVPGTSLGSAATMRTSPTSSAPPPSVAPPVSAPPRLAAPRQPPPPLRQPPPPRTLKTASSLSLKTASSYRGSSLGSAARPSGGSSSLSSAATSKSSLGAAVQKGSSSLSKAAMKPKK